MHPVFPDPLPESKRPRAWRPGEFLSSFSLIPALLCLPLGVLAVLGLWCAASFRDLCYPLLLRTYPKLEDVFSPYEAPSLLVALAVACGTCSGVCVVASLLGVLRKGWALHVLRKGYLAAYVLFVFYGYVVLNVTGQVQDFAVKIAEAQGKRPPDGLLVDTFVWRCEWLWPATCIVILLGILHVLSWRRAAVNLYTGADEQFPAAGDKIIENVRTHGRDPAYRKSVLGSFAAHVLVIIIIPLLLRLQGCIRPYHIPLGSGSPAVAMARIVTPRKKKVKRKKYILSVDSAIIFDIPDLEDSDLLKEVEEETNLTYTADASADHGAMGTGGGNTPGWADGFADGEVRFIRLEHGGPDWDDGMDSISRADLNFLEEFQRLAGGIKVAKHSESHPISYLRKYPKGEAPPFVYMTGTGEIPVSQSDLKILREYIHGGGMLFADCGSSRFNGYFRAFAGKLFPGNRLRPIADDDPIFQIPFTFAHGPPPLWHHGGSTTMGIKCKGRWGLFYFPGDLNDAWKTGNSGIDPELVKSAFYLGTNVVYYSFTHYLQETRKYRK